jgi:predicted kinase
VLVPVSGLPGTGKSSLAGPLAHRIRAAAMSRDNALRDVEGRWRPRPCDRRFFGGRRRRLQERATQRLESTAADQLSKGLPVLVEVVADRIAKRTSRSYVAAPDAVVLDSCLHRPSYSN